MRGEREGEDARALSLLLECRVHNTHGAAAARPMGGHERQRRQECIYRFKEKDSCGGGGGGDGCSVGAKYATDASHPVAVYCVRVACLTRTLNCSREIFHKGHS